MKTNFTLDPISRVTSEPFPILPKFEIMVWLKRYFAIPAGFRMCRLKRLAEITGYTERLFYMILRDGYPISHDMQINFSRMIHQLGSPKQRQKEWPPGGARRNMVPEEILREFAEAVASLQWNEAQREFGLDPGMIKACKLGFAPQFKIKTLRRLYPELVGKPFTW